MYTIPLYITIAQILLSVTVPQKRSAPSELCEDYNAKEAPQSDTSSDDDFVKTAFTEVQKKKSKTVPLKKQGKIFKFFQKTLIKYLLFNLISDNQKEHRAHADHYYRRRFFKLIKFEETNR